MIWSFWYEEETQQKRRVGGSVFIWSLRPVLLSVILDAQMEYIVPSPDTFDCSKDVHQT